MTTFTERLQQALDDRSKSIADLIAGSKLSKQTIYAMFREGFMPEKVWLGTIKAVCRFLKINPSWLIDGPPHPMYFATDSDEWANIRAYSQAVGLGDGKEGDDYAEAFKLKFRAQSLARKKLKPENLRVVYGDGDSMFPRIRTGDAILYDASDTQPRDETIFVIRRGRDYSAKTCMLLDGVAYFKAENPNGDHNWRKPVRKDDPKNPIEILGRVRWIGSWED